MEKNYIVYKHINIVNGKIYIGITNNINRRWRDKGIEYKPHKNENQNRPFWNAIQKYGWNNFKHSILESGLSFEEACCKEKMYIKKFSSNNKKNGYNIAPGGNGGKIYLTHPRGMLGHKQTDHQKASHSSWMKEISNNPMENGQVVWGITHPHPKGFMGHKRTEEEKDKIRQTIIEKGISKKRLKVTYSNGGVVFFDCLNDCMATLHFTAGLFYGNIQKNNGYYRLKKGSRYQSNPDFIKLNGAHFEYVKEGAPNG